VGERFPRGVEHWLVWMSRSVGRVLRYEASNPREMTCDHDSGGWAAVDNRIKVVNHIYSRRGWQNVMDNERNKYRLLDRLTLMGLMFSVPKGGLHLGIVRKQGCPRKWMYVRAVQGHTLSYLREERVSKKLTLDTRHRTVQALWHGTTLDRLNNILREGLLPGGRGHGSPLRPVVPRAIPVGDKRYC